MYFAPRALATRLATGAGAIYWHVTNKDELLVAATESVVARMMGEGQAKTKPRDAIHHIALGIFDAIDTHPWVGAQLSHAPNIRLRKIAEHLPGHDDRKEYLAGIDLILGSLMK